MDKTDKLDDSFFCERAPDSASLITIVIYAIFGCIVVPITLAYAVNFICAFTGIEYDAVLVLTEFVEGLPAPVNEWLGQLLQWIEALIAEYILQ